MHILDGLINLTALRKIVRNQSKMVQRPFSDDGSNSNIVWKNMTLPRNEALMPGGYTQVKTVFHKMQRPKMSTILSSVETGRGKATYSRTKIARNEIAPPIELRHARNTINNVTLMDFQSTTVQSILFQPFSRNNSYPEKVSVGTYYQMREPAPSKFFPSGDDRELQSVEQKINARDSTIVIPASPVGKENSSVIVKGIFIADTKGKSKNLITDLRSNVAISAENDEKVDFLLEEVSDSMSRYSYNVTNNPYTCIVMQETKADIDAPAQFSNLNIEVNFLLGFILQFVNMRLFICFLFYSLRGLTRNTTGILFLIVAMNH